MQFPITECPYCGNDEIKIKCKISGECEYNLRKANWQICVL